MISYTTSEPIHSLGINKGDMVILDYDSFDSAELFKDLEIKRIKILYKNSSEEFESILIDSKLGFNK